MFMRDMAWFTSSFGAAWGAFFDGKVGNGLSMGMALIGAG
jgi:hypothetical protein